VTSGAESGVGIVVGVTGGVGSGKSTVAGMLARLGAELVELDGIGHELLGDRAVRAELRRGFPEAFEGSPPDEVARRRLAERVFADARELERLNRVIHPRMKDEVRRRVGIFRAGAKGGVMVIEGSLVLELGLRDLCDRLVFVDAPEDIRFARAEAFRGWGPGEARRRENAQASLESKRGAADAVIDGSGSRENVERQVRRLWEEIQHER